MDKESMEMFQKILDRLDKMDSRFDVIEHKQDRTEKKVDDLRLDVAVAGRDIRRDIYELKDEMETVIEVLKINEMLPR
jgi:phage shock protein A